MIKAFYSTLERIDAQVIHGAFFLRFPIIS